MELGGGDTLLSREELLTQQTYSEQAHRYALTRGRNVWAEEMESLAHVAPGRRLLEVGCGTGRDVPYLSSCGFEYTGCDLSKEMLAEARANNPNATFFSANLYDLKIPEKVDAIWCAAVLVHIPRRRINLALRRLHDCLTPGGVAFISIKSGEGEELTTTARDTGNGLRFYCYWDVRAFTEELEKADFRVVEQGSKFLSTPPTWLTFLVQRT